MVNADCRLVTKPPKELSAFVTQTLSINFDMEGGASVKAGGGSEVLNSGCMYAIRGYLLIMCFDSGSCK